MATIEHICDDFERKLILFRKEITIVEDCFYLHKTIHVAMAENRAIYNEINRNSFFWQTILNSAQVNLFITLGRIFDDDATSYSAGHLLKLCLQNPEIFSKAQLRKRKAIGLSPEGLEKYMKNIPEEPASIDDLELLKKQLESCAEIFRKHYKKIRNKLFGHRDIKCIGKEQKLFAGTAIGETEAILDLLDRTGMALFDLYHNGRPLDVNTTNSTGFKDNLIEHTRNVLEGLHRKETG